LLPHSKNKQGHFLSRFLKAGPVFRQRHVYAAWFGLHFLLIISFSLRDTLRLAAQGPTIFPPYSKNLSQKAETVLSFALGQRLPGSNPIRQAIAMYLRLAGIETGYGYFAPHVPGSYRLVFELHYPDGRVEYELPSVTGAAAGLRLASLLDKIGRTPYDAFREHLVKMLVATIWREHPEVKTIRAVFGSINLPSVTEFQRGKRESYQFLYAYDFTLENESEEPKDR
jgi:hypothetical protein